MCDTTKECIRAALEGAGTAVAADAIDACVRLAQWMAPKAARLGLTQFDTAADIAEQGRRAARQLISQIEGLPIRGMTVLSVRPVIRDTSLPDGPARAGRR